MNSQTVSQYEQDFYGWTQWQVQVLAKRQVSELDWQNLQEELEALGRQEYRELVSRLTVLLGFLTIREQRRAINRHLYRNPSLKARISDALEDGFEAGVDLALRETNLPLKTFPEKCPYKFEDAMAHPRRFAIADSFLCDTSQDWE